MHGVSILFTNLDAFQAYIKGNKTTKSQMVMAAVIVATDQSELEMVKPGALHERLVEHVRIVSGEPNTQAGVWGEHSYARPRGVATDPLIRTLLAPRPASPGDDDDELDVEGAPLSPPAPPLDTDERDECDGDWEQRVGAFAPTAGHARLAGEAAATLIALRLERLSGRTGRWQREDGTRAAAWRLRRALASHWTSGAAGWLHSTLATSLPRSLKPLYDELVAELWRAVPRLAERLSAPRPAASKGDPLAVVGERRRASEPGPWLAWAPSGSDAEDSRWVRRLGALLHVRELCGAAPAAPGMAPDRWCATLAHEARTSLDELLTEAGRRPVLLGGAGAGAALGMWLAAGGAGARIRGLVLLAPPLLTAEGPRDATDEKGDEPDAPMLCVVGDAGAACWRSAAAELCARAGRGGRSGARRVLVVAGADDSLRVPRDTRRRLRVPQHALDAAVVEEGARWALDVADAPPRERLRRKVGEDERATPTTRSIEIVEGRVVQRAGGAVGLDLQPPRRAAPRVPPADDALAAADIMQLPIVFADDDPPSEDAALAPLTVTSGHPRAVRYTRVILAKRTTRRRPPRQH